MSTVNSTDISALSESVARNLQQNRRLAFAQIGPDLIFRQVSPGFLKMVNRSQLSPVGEPLTEVLWEFVGSEPLLEQIVSGERSTYRLEHVNVMDETGEPRYRTLQVAPIDESNPTEGLLLIIEDSSEYGQLHQHLVQDRNELRLLRQQLALANEELRQLNQLKSLFLSMAAHDLRSPLTSIRGFSELLLDEVDSGIQQEFLEIIVTQADRMQRLIGDFLDLDQIERGELVIEAEYCNVIQITSDVVAALRPMVSAKRQTLQLNLPSQPILIWADPDRLSQILYNLIGNSLKYSLEGGAIDVAVRRVDKEVEFEISDSGLGISAEETGRLFNLYYRSDGVRHSKITGTGLGLYIVKMLVEAHNGHVTVKSQPGRGSTFIVRLPAGQPIPTGV